MMTSSNSNTQYGDNNNNSSISVRISSSSFDSRRSTPPVNIAERTSFNVMSTRQTCVNLLASIDSLLTLQCAGHGPVPPDVCNEITLTGHPLSLTALRIAAMRKLSGIPITFSSSSSSTTTSTTTTATSLP